MPGKVGLRVAEASEVDDPADLRLFRGLTKVMGGPEGPVSSKPAPLDMLWTR